MSEQMQSHELISNLKSVDREALRVLTEPFFVQAEGKPVYLSFADGRVYAGLEPASQVKGKPEEKPDNVSVHSFDELIRMLESS